MKKLILSLIPLFLLVAVAQAEYACVDSASGFGTDPTCTSGATNVNLAGVATTPADPVDVKNSNGRISTVTTLTVTAGAYSALDVVGGVNLQ